MSETITITRARIEWDGGDGSILGIIATNSEAPIGQPRADMSKITITASGGPVTVRPVPETRANPNDPWWTLPGYSYLGREIDGAPLVLKSRIPLSRKILQSETLTIDFDAGFFTDGANTSEASADFVGEVCTRLDSEGNVSHEALRRVGGRRERVDPTTLTPAPTLVILASDAAGAGDGGTITSFTATAGGTIGVSGSGNAIYRADGVAGGLVNGSTGCPVIELPAGKSLTTSVNLGSSTADYTVLVMHAFGGTSGNITMVGSSIRCNVGDGGTTRSVQNIGVAGIGFGMGGNYENTASAAFRRLQVSGGSYRHTGTVAQVYGYGGALNRLPSPAATIYDHSVNITITANSTTAYIAGIVVIPTADAATVLARQVGGWMDHVCNTTNRVFFVDPAAGNDTNSGLTEAAPRLTLPVLNSSSTNAFAYGAGDVVVVKRGTITPDTSISNRPLFLGTFGYSSQYPGGIGVYGPRADGYWSLPGNNASTNVFMHQQNPHFFIWGLSAPQSRRNPLDPDGHYDGFATAKDLSGGTIQAELGTALVASILGDPDLDPPCQQFIDCDSQFAKDKCFLDSNGAYSGENWSSFINCIPDRNWFDMLAANIDNARPSGFFCASTAMLLITGCAGRQVGAMWDEPASIGDHSMGERVYTAEASATYSAGTNETTVTLTGIATRYIPGGSAARGIVRCTRTSDATVIRAEIKSKTNNNTFVINGNPYGLTDAATVTDARFHGGLPAAPDARDHFVYIANDAPGGECAINNVVGGAASDAFQHRAGGIVGDNYISDAAVGGFVADVGTGIIDGNVIDRGHRNYSNFGSGRVFGFEFNGALGRGFIQNNIINLSPTGFGSDVVGGQASGSYAIAFSLNSGNTGTFTARNNTICRLPDPTFGRGIFAGSANSNGAVKVIERNIIQGDETYGPGANLASTLAQVNATFTRNAWWSPDGESDDIFGDGTQTFAEFATAVGETGGIFSRTDFEGGEAPLSFAASYYATLPGGSEDDEAWITATLNQMRTTGRLSTLGAPAIVDYARQWVRPTNRTLLEGDGILMGAVALAEDPAPTLSITDDDGDPLETAISFPTSRLTTPALTRSIRLYANGADFPCEDLLTQEAGIATIQSYATSSGTPIGNISTYTIPADDYVTVTILLNRLTVADGQTGAVQFNGELEGFGTVEVNFDIDVKEPLTITKNDESPFGTPETAITTQGSNASRTARLTAGPSGLTGINIGTSGIVSLPGFGAIPISLGGAATANIALSLSASEVGAAQPGVFSVSAAGGVSETINFSLTVNAPDPTLPVLTMTLDGSSVVSGQVITRSAQPSDDPLTFTLVLTEINGIAATLGTLGASGNLTITGTNPSGGTIDADGTELVTLALDISEAGVRSGVLTIPVDELEEPYILIFRAGVGLTGQRSRDRSRAR